MVVADYRNDEVHFDTEDVFVGTVENLDGHINFENKTVMEMGVRLYSDKILTENLERKLLYSTDPEEATQAIVQVVKEHIDPTVFTDFGGAYFSKQVTVSFKV